MKTSSGAQKQPNGKDKAVDKVHGKKSQALPRKVQWTPETHKGVDVNEDVNGGSEEEVEEVEEVEEQGIAEPEVPEDTIEVSTHNTSLNIAHSDAPRSRAPTLGESTNPGNPR